MHRRLRDVLCRSQHNAGAEAVLAPLCFGLFLAAYTLLTQHKCASKATTVDQITLYQSIIVLILPWYMCQALNLLIKILLR